jgi:peptidoglycan hydrolase-like protein with peptidoglycan-binding domain
MHAARLAPGEGLETRRLGAQAARSQLPGKSGPVSRPHDARAVLQLQRTVGNARVAAMLQRCGAGGCSCGGACRREEELPLADRTRAGLHRSPARIARQPRRVRALQRAQVINDALRLEADLWKDKDRLQRAFHNNPTLTGRDAPADVGLLQQALDTVFRAMPNSKQTASGVTVFDGKWGNETVGTVRDYQVAKGIRPPGGFEAGRKTLAALDADLRSRRAPTPPPRPAPPPSPPPPAPAKVCGPDVASEMARAWASAQTQFRALSFGKKLGNCRMLVQPLIRDPDTGNLRLNADAFDTWGLFQGSVGWTRVPPWHGSCGTPGSSGDMRCMFDSRHEAEDVCSNTVQIGSNCWLSGTPNYGLFGIAMRECFDWTSLLGAVPSVGVLHDLFSLESTIALVGGYKALKGDNIIGPEKWAIAAWLGGPRATVGGGNRQGCSRTCPGPPPPPFAIVWEPNMSRNDAPGGPPYTPTDMIPGC